VPRTYSRWRRSDGTDDTACPAPTGPGTASEIDRGVIYCDTPTHIDVETFARQPGGAARKALIAEAAERHAARGA